MKFIVDKYHCAYSDQPLDLGHGLLASLTCSESDDYFYCSIKFTGDGVDKYLSRRRILIIDTPTKRLHTILIHQEEFTPDDHCIEARCGIGISDICNSVSISMHLDEDLSSPTLISFSDEVCNEFQSHIRALRQAVLQRSRTVGPWSFNLQSVYKTGEPYTLAKGTILGLYYNCINGDERFRINYREGVKDWFCWSDSDEPATDLTGQPFVVRAGGVTLLERPLDELDLKAEVLRLEDYRPVVYCVEVTRKELARLAFAKNLEMQVGEKHFDTHACSGVPWFCQRFLRDALDLSMIDCAKALQ